MSLKRSNDMADATNQPKLDEARKILRDSLAMEKKAEELCKEILGGLAINGFHDDIDRIRNDEIRHQLLVNKLIEYLG